MFEVNGEYANRKGKYTVLEIDAPKMYVRYQDGTHAELNMNVQARIWENIVAEQEAEAATRSARAARRGTQVNQHFIKVVSITSVEELTFPGWPEQVVMVGAAEEAQPVKSGDRLIYYALESQTFFAVATIIGDAFTANPKEYFFKNDVQTARFFPIDVDAVAPNLERGLPVDDVELESYPNLEKMRLKVESLLKISEDDFELLAELLTEVSEGEDGDFDNDEYDEEDEL